MITATHNGVEITYDEHRDKWTFTAHGQEQETSSLKDAKKVIDNPPAKAFKRCNAWLVWGDDPEACEVTSIARADRLYAEGREAWVTDSDGDRRKVSISRLAKDTPHNGQIIKQMKGIRAAIEKLETKLTELRGKLEAFAIE